VAVVIGFEPVSSGTPSGTNVGHVFAVYDLLGVSQVISNPPLPHSDILLTHSQKKPAHGTFTIEVPLTKKTLEGFHSGRYTISAVPIIVAGAEDGIGANQAFQEVITIKI
jgi:hypothetical protein